MRSHVAILAAAGWALLALAGPPAAAAPPPGEVYLVQGIVGSSWSFSVDGETAESGVAAKEVVGPLRLDPGRHRVEATSEDGTSVRASVAVRPGQSLDVVLHLPVEATEPAVLTSFVNDLSAVPDGMTRLAIAHTAAVGPADIRVDGKVLFADVASGEELTVTVPADTYRVAVVPTATDGPPVLGPVDLPVPAGKSLRVYAIGVAEEGTMDAVLHELSVPVRGSDSAPAGIPGGTGGQQAASGTGPAAPALALGGVAALIGALLLAGAALRGGRVTPSA